MKKQFAPACERNQAAILDVLKTVVKASDKHLLEIGSGTGQHAVFMSPHFPHLQWHTSDVLANHKDINLWLDDAQIKNLSKPLFYAAGQTDLPHIDIDIVFTANTLHIMSWDNVKTLISQLGQKLKKGSQVLYYGPFNYAGNFTSQSNANFDVWLKQQEAHRGIRDFEAIVDLMEKAGLKLLNDIEMPANNRILHFTFV